MTTTKKNAVEVLATRTETGFYGFTYTSKLVRRGDDHYLLHDQWSGGNLGEEMYRPFLILVSPENVAETKAALSGDEPGWIDFCADILPYYTTLGIVTRSPRTRWAMNV